MKRKENESFEEYKARRAASNLAVKQINKDSRGGNRTSREIARANATYLGNKTYSYGELLRSHFARKTLEIIKAKKAADK